MEENRPVVPFLRYYLAHDLRSMVTTYPAIKQSADTQHGVCDQSVIILTGIETELGTTFIHR